MHSFNLKLCDPPCLWLKKMFVCLCVLWYAFAEMSPQVESILKEPIDHKCCEFSLMTSTCAFKSYSVSFVVSKRTAMLLKLKYFCRKSTCFLACTMFSTMFNKLINTLWEGKATWARERQYIDYSQTTDHDYIQTEKERAGRGGFRFLLVLSMNYFKKSPFYFLEFNVDASRSPSELSFLNNRSVH